MYEFAAVTLLGLATLKVVDLLAELVPGIVRVRALTTFIVAIAAVIALDYSVFNGFGIAVDNDGLATVVTGLIVGSLAAAWEAVLGWFGVSGGAGNERTRTNRPRIAA